MNGNASWVEPPPRQQRLGCFAKGCLILVVFFILLGLAFVSGYYFAVRILRSEYFSTQHLTLPTSTATTDEAAEVRMRWETFKRSARKHEPARIELTGDDLNALIASDSELRGNAYVSIEDHTLNVQASLPLETFRWLRGYYLNGKCSIQAATDGNPRNARIINVILNGQSVGNDVLSQNYQAWFGRYIPDWATHSDLRTLEIAEGKLILETKGRE